MIAPLPGVTALKAGSAQVPLPGIVAEVVDDAGEPVGPGQTGYLVLTEPWPAMLRGIWGDEQRFKDTYWSRFPGRYFAGDGAKRDDDGDIWLLGRVDDVMNVSGHRLSTAEIESALVSHPDVAEAAVVGATDETTGQAVVAFVILRGGHEQGPDTVADLRNHVAKEIGPIAKPKSIMVVAELPKTRSGKIMRRLLRDVAEHRTARGRHDAHRLLGDGRHLGGDERHPPGLTAQDGFDSSTAPPPPTGASGQGVRHCGAVPREPRPRSAAALAGTVVATGVVAAGAAVVGAPDWFGLAGERPFVWTVPFRVPVGLGLAGLAVLTGLTGLRWRRTLPAATALALAAAGSLGTTLARGVSAGELPAAAPGTSPSWPPTSSSPAPTARAWPASPSTVGPTSSPCRSRRGSTPTTSPPASRGPRAPACRCSSATTATAASGRRCSSPTGWGSTG